MLKKIVEVIVCGAIGATALYVVGRVAYRAGQEIAREECRYEILRHENAVSEKTEIASTDEAETDQLPIRAETTVPVHMYVNDAISFKMTPEQPLYYSPNCYGTADSISFRGGKLRIHDLKTGKIPAKIEQLMIYAALFCLEYKVDPSKIETELRIYQSDEILYHRPEANEILPKMEKIVRFDKIIEDIREREE